MILQKVQTEGITKSTQLLANGDSGLVFKLLKNPIATKPHNRDSKHFCPAVPHAYLSSSLIAEVLLKPDI
jgi:hypothetical protein